MEILYHDKDIIVCIKPAGMLSTDEPGGLPELIRQTIGTDNVRTVHRLDRVVSGVMVLALNSKSASELSRQIRDDEFDKSYLAVVHGKTEKTGRMEDLLVRVKEERKTYVTDTPSKESRNAVLNYSTLAQNDELSLVDIKLVTGRTHQIRCQFSARNYPLVGDRKYSLLEDDCNIALWSHSISFKHPKTGNDMIFIHEPPQEYPWNLFEY